MIEAKKPHPMLTLRDFNRHNSWLRILALCVKTSSYAQMADATRLSAQTVGNYCRQLEKEGYLSCQDIEQGKFRQMVKFYTTLKADYPIEDLVPVSVKINAGMARNGTSVGKKATVSRDVSQKVEAKLAQNVTVVKERHVKSTYRTEFRGIGSSMGMVW